MLYYLSCLFPDFLSRPTPAPVHNRDRLLNKTDKRCLSCNGMIKQGFEINMRPKSSAVPFRSFDLFFFWSSFVKMGGSPSRRLHVTPSSALFYVQSFICVSFAVSQGGKAGARWPGRRGLPPQVEPGPCGRRSSVRFRESLLTDEGETDTRVDYKNTSDAIQLCAEQHLSIRRGGRALEER